MSHCLYCGREEVSQLNWRRFLFLEEAPVLCDACLKGFVRIKGKQCVGCSRPLDELDSAFVEGNCCRDCVRWEQDPIYQGTLSGNDSLYTYNQQMKEFIARFKYRGDYVLAQCFAQEIRKRVKEQSFDYVTAIPLSDERERERGFNQAKALAVEAGFAVTDLLTRLHTEKQSKKTRTERIHLPQVFHPVKNLDLSSKKVLIIDDIYTTGSTLRHAALVLKQAGAKEVRSFTLSRG